MHFGKNDKNMNITLKVILFCFILLLGACADYKTDKPKQIKEKKFYSSSGFALIYGAGLFEEGGIDRRLNNNEIIDNILNNQQILAMHSSLKRNTVIQIINPVTAKVVETKISKKANYPKIFNIVLSKKMIKNEKNFKYCITIPYIYLYLQNLNYLN